MSRRVGRGLDDAPGDDAVRHAADGDETAFRRLYLELHPRLLQYARSLVGQDAEDVTSEAWLQIARDLRSFDDGLDAFRAWTARIVRNRAMDLLRSRSRRPVEVVPTEHFVERPSPDDPELASIVNMSTESVVALIGSLPREQAEAIMLRVVIGLDARRAGQVLGKSAAAVRTAAHRGLRTLESRLQTTRPDVLPPIVPAPLRRRSRGVHR